MNRLKTTFIAFLILSSYHFVLGQNQISVPFNNGFVGNSAGQNSSNLAYYTSGSNGIGLGWSNLQFTQNSTASIFTMQGNDIVGSVLITDANGIEHIINGFIKWRAPNGTITTICFQPTTGTNVTLATNGTNVSSTYTINDTKYIGLTFNGMVLTIPSTGNNAGSVAGNAATGAQVLDDLNIYLATFPSLSINDVVLNEGNTATLTITLSAASSTNTITVNYTTLAGTALSPSDYAVISGQLIFSPGQTSKTISVPIINDNIEELSEIFYISLTDPVNASIKDASGSITINPSSGPLPVELFSFSVSCASNGLDIHWSTASEHNSLEFKIEKSRDGYTWNTLETIPAAGNSTQLLNYSVFDLERNVQTPIYYRLNQIDIDGKNEIFGPITANCALNGFFAQLTPNPTQNDSELFVLSEKEAIADITVHNQFGQSIFTQTSLIKRGSNTVLIPSSAFTTGVYTVQLRLDGKLTILKLVVL